MFTKDEGKQYRSCRANVAYWRRELMQEVMSFRVHYRRERGNTGGHALFSAEYTKDGKKHCMRVLLAVLEKQAMHGVVSVGVV